MLLLKSEQDALDIAHCNTAVELDRYDSTALANSAIVNYDLNNFEASVNDFKDSLKYDNDKDTILYSNFMLGYINLFKLKNYKDAVTYNKEAIELDSENKYLDAHYGLASSLYLLKNCDYVEAGNKYLSLCTKDECSETHVNWLKGKVAKAYKRLG